MRGQAVSELALLMLVLVTVLVFGVHFAEVHTLGIRAQEAAQAALFDTTALKMHDASTGNWGYADVAIHTAAAATLENYADREGRHAATTRATTDWAFTRADVMEMECGNEGGVDLSPVKPLQNSYPKGDTLMSCTAGLLVKGFRIPLSFVDQGPAGFFKHSHRENLDYGLCAAGQSRNMLCNQRYTILLDDWGYSGPEERKECPLNGEGGGECANRGYWHMVERAYQVQLAAPTPGGVGGKRTAASDLAKHTVGESPIDENHFYLSFRGWESSVSRYADTVKTSHKQVEWETSPWSDPVEYKKSKRENCWLGLPCQ